MARVYSWPPCICATSLLTRERQHAYSRSESNREANSIATHRPCYRRPIHVLQAGLRIARAVIAMLSDNSDQHTQNAQDYELFDWMLVRLLVIAERCEDGKAR